MPFSFAPPRQAEGSGEQVPTGSTATASSSVSAPSSTDNRVGSNFAQFFAAYPPPGPRSPIPFGVSSGDLRSRTTTSNPTTQFGGTATRPSSLVAAAAAPSFGGGGSRPSSMRFGFGSSATTTFGSSSRNAFGSSRPSQSRPSGAFVPEQGGLFPASDPDPTSGGEFSFGSAPDLAGVCPGPAPAPATRVFSYVGGARRPRGGFASTPDGTIPSPQATFTFGGAVVSRPGMSTTSESTATSASTDSATNDGSSNDGPEEILPPALPKESDETDDETKWDKYDVGVSKLASIASDLTCPITLQLPWEPVIADDGRIYEKSAIEEYFRTPTRIFGGSIRSPVTNLPMGTRITTALQVRNVIDTLVEAGTITGDLANSWKEKSSQKKKIVDLLKKAEGGDVDAMVNVAVGFNNGSVGLQKDFKQAYKWFEKAHLAGSVYGTSKVGEYLIGGFGVEKDMAKGMMYLGMAVGEGSDLAAYILGFHMAEGRHGVPVDKVVARKLLEKCLSGTCVHKTIGPEHMTMAQNKLNALVSEN